MHSLSRAEFENTLTHGVGIVLSAAGSLVLIASAVAGGDGWRIAGCCVFAASLVAVYVFSTLSHGVTHARARHWLRAMDQGAIYLLIVGTYTPFALAYLRSGWWLLFLGLMWAIALAGFVSKAVFTHRVDAIGVRSYLLLGWMALVPALGHNGAIPFMAVGLIFAGGLCYSLGTIFLKIDHKSLRFHAIWHLWVIGGSTCHFLAVLLFVARSTV